MISTHILDLSTGFPAAEVPVTLERRVEGHWQILASLKTNADGRISFDCPRDAGAYQLTFGVESYFERHGLTPFFLNVPIAFQIHDTARKYHVPLLLSPYGLSTYRGS